MLTVDMVNARLNEPAGKLVQIIYHCIYYNNS